MSSKNKYVLNLTGFTNCPTPWKHWILKFCRQFPEAAMFCFLEDATDPELHSFKNLKPFVNTEDILNGLQGSTECVINLMPAWEPEVTPVATILILPVASKCQFWSVDMPNPLGIQGEALKEIGLRSNMIVSNSPELLELFKNTNLRSEKYFIHQNLESISELDLKKWVEFAIADFEKISADQSPLVSVVTPSYNQGKFLGRTLRSVFSQNYPNIEYFVVDGGSTDNTIEILSEFKNKVQWVSEKDSGYPEAVNKGFGKCKGKYLMWLPSDDMLFSNSSISALVKAAEETNADIVYGDAFYVDQDDRYLGSYRTTTYSPEELKDWSLICQPAALFRADLFRKVGGLNQSFRCISDYDLWLRMSDAGARFHRIGRPISCYRIHGDSLTVKQKNISYREIFDLQLSRYSRVNRSWVMGAFKEIVLQQNLGLRWRKAGLKTDQVSLFSFQLIRRLLKIAVESFLAENPYFQRFIRRRIEPREPIWARER